MTKEKCRYVSTAFWDDEWIQSLDPSEKLLYLYLLTNPLTNIAGVYKITIRRMCFDTGFNADTVTHILRKFETAQKVFMFSEWLILPNWPKHQKVGEKDNNRKGIDDILSSLPDDLFQFVVEHGYEYAFLKDLARYYEGAYKGLIRSSNYINLNSNINSNINNKKEDIAPAAPSPAPQKRFTKPNIQEITDYCHERNNAVNPQAFIDFYESNGWRVGKNAMKDWRAAVRTWEQRDGKQKAKPDTQSWIDELEAKQGAAV